MGRSAPGRLGGITDEHLDFSLADRVGIIPIRISRKIVLTTESQAIHINAPATLEMKVKLGSGCPPP
jgi:hypothetical protein